MKVGNVIKELPTGPSDSSMLRLAQLMKDTFFCSVTTIIINMTRSRRSSNTIQGFETRSLFSSTKLKTLRFASPHKPKPSRETRFESWNTLMLRSSSAQSTESELEDEVVHLLVAHHSWLHPWHHLCTNVCTRCSQLGRWMHWKFHIRDVCALDW